ncbi:MAG TPA: tyrosine-type recombinase/integrase [Mycobacterium sp.]
MGTTRRKAGLLGSEVEGYRAWLTGRGYTPQTTRNMLKDLGKLGLWLQVERLQVSDLDEQLMADFVASQKAAGKCRAFGPRAMVPLLWYLREAGAAPQAPDSDAPLDVLLEQYRSWMRRERGLAEPTVLRYANTARRFLAEQAVRDGVLVPAVLTGADINAFLLRECARVSAGSAKGRVAELRSVLRFLYLQGLTPRRLGSAVPPVGGWRLAALPPAAMSAADVQRVVDGVDRATDVGARDFAIMMLVARLGLRSIEIARLQLFDVDWRAGELVVRGKARRQDRLPLPADVGEALVAYLSRGRNPRGAADLFLTCRAPRGPIRADLVGDVVERACLRAGVSPVGPHRLRHALAGELLRRGAGLTAISQVLRHQDLATTAIYAKVDLVALRAVARQWPGAAR